VSGHHDAGRPAHLQHHFDTPVRQFDASKLGMWLFLATEVLLFGGLFCAYAIYRASHPEVFIWAHQFLDRGLGATNTVILLCSSLTMAWAVRAAQLGQRRLLVALLGLTILGGLGFMGIKFVEYKAKWEHGLLWARSYHPVDHGTPPPEAAAAPVPAALAPAAPVPPAGGAALERTQLAPAAAGPAGLAAPPAAEADHAGAHPAAPVNAQLFFSVYFLMTGLHGLHVLAGMGAIAWVLLRAWRDEFGPAYFTPVDLVGLYWHLVDLIWIFLFPLLYLIH